MPLLGRRTHKKSHKKDKKHSVKKTLGQRLRNRFTKKKVNPETASIEKLKSKKHLRARAKYLQNELNTSRKVNEELNTNIEIITKNLQKYKTQALELKVENDELKRKIKELTIKAPPVPPRKPVVPEREPADSVEPMATPKDSKTSEDNYITVEPASATVNKETESDEYMSVQPASENNSSSGSETEMKTAEGNDSSSINLT
jgi:predicted ribosome quality control (RQC) complex YloA/Tae2 family protein